MNIRYPIYEGVYRILTLCQIGMDFVQYNCINTLQFETPVQ